MSDNLPPDSASSDNDTNKPQLGFDPKLGESIQVGFSAMQQLLTGFVQSLQDVVGPEGAQQLKLSQQLGLLAGALEEISADLRNGVGITPQKSGELEFYFEQLTELLTQPGDRALQTAIQQRINAAKQTLQYAPTNPAEETTKQLAAVSGYLRAAARSLLPSQPQ
ncbi:MAG: hypothetical protein JNK90_24795 [Planctomycetaceae bacterium]|nr:hypothetical protein [Planctomycetaceae bacterium]MBN8601980.1 hypothetical protein [Planctomycetota bacterium]